MSGQDDRRGDHVRTETATAASAGARAAGGLSLYRWLVCVHGGNWSDPWLVVAYTWREARARGVANVLRLARMQRAERAGDGAGVVPAWLSVEVVAWPAWGPVPLTIAAGYADNDETEGTA